MISIPILVLVFQITGTVPPVVESYATKYDHIDIDAILNNRRMVNYYAACMLSKGPCPPEGLEFKRILPEALQTNCEKCTEKQKTVILRVIKRLRKEYPKVWAQLSLFWDPDGKFYDKFVATYSIRSPATDPTAPQQQNIINNRFDNSDSEANANNIIKNSESTTKTTTSKPKKYTTTVPSITTQKITYPYPNAINPSTTTHRQPTSFYPINAINPTTTTKQPNTNIYVATSTKPRPTANVGVNLQSTVSLGVNIVDGIVRGLGDLGRGVMETGAQIAEVVLKGVQQVVRPL